MLKNHNLLFLLLLFLAISVLAPQSVFAIDYTGCTAEYCRINAGHQLLIYQCPFEVWLIKNNGNIDFFVPMKTCTEYVDYIINAPLPDDFEIDDPILLNSASGVNCNARCGEVGGGCISIGTNLAANNGKYKSYLDAYGYATCPDWIGNCSTVMIKENNYTCGGIRVQWTYCLCGAPD